MTGKIKVGGKVNSKIRTFYMDPPDVEVLDTVAASMNMNRRELIRHATAPFIEKLRSGEIQVPKFNFNEKERDLVRVKKRIKEHLDCLEGEKIGRQNAYLVLVDFAVSLGSDEALVKNYDDLVASLNAYKFSGGEQFNYSQFLTFKLL